MNLPFLKPKNPPAYYLILLLREEWVTAIVFQQTGKSTSIVGLGREHFKEPLSQAPMEEWMETLDKAISKAENSLPPSVETHKTLFGVREDWVEDSKIKKEYLETLKKVSDTLDLEPIGFLVITETLSHYLQKQEGSPISALFVEISDTTILVNLVRAGRIIETTSVKRSENANHDTDLAFKQLRNAQVLPSRIIIYQELFDKDIAQQFISHTWSKTLPFLHVPQILPLPDQFDVKASIYAAATQMGLTPPEEIESFVVEESPIKPFNVQPASSHHVEVPAKEEVIPQHPAHKQVDIASLGFIHNEDVLKTQKPVPEESIINTTEETIESDSITMLEEHHKPKENQDDIEAKSESIASGQSFLTPFIQTALSFPTNLFERFQNKNTSHTPKENGKFAQKKFLLVGIALAIIIVFALLYFVFLNATITITVKPETIHEKKDITLSVSEPEDFSKNIISGEILSVSENGSTTTAATGKKETGDKAKGTVTIYSKLPSTKTIPQGTVVTSSNDLDFVLDKDVTVASSSADASASPTTAKANVTAKEIGKESNLPSNMKFSVGTFSASEVVAKNDSAFSGGSKTETTVVSQKDVDTATKALGNKLSSKAKQSIVKKIPQNKSILPLFTNTTLSKKELGQKIGQAVKNLTLSGTITYETIAYPTEDIRKFAEFIAKDRLSSKTSLDDNIEYKIENVSVKDPKNAQGNLSFTALLLPQINKEDLAKQLKGSSFSDAKKTIESFPQIEDSQISTNIPLPFFQFLPQQEKNITIIIKNE